jgi:pyruvate dehydrogenase E1 component
MVSDMTDDDIWHLLRGGHDPRKVYAAYHAAVNHKGQPTVILAKTVKGYGMGAAGEAQNSQKKINDEEIKNFRDRFGLPISDEDLEQIPFIKPDEDSDEMRYL